MTEQKTKRVVKKRLRSEYQWALIERHGEAGYWVVTVGWNDKPFVGYMVRTYPVRQHTWESITKMITRHINE